MLLLSDCGGSCAAQIVASVTRVVLRAPTDLTDVRLFQTTEPFATRVASAPDSVAVLRGEITAIAARRGLTGTALSDVTLAVSEAATNAVVHGSAAPTARIGMSVEFARGAMQVTISDDGSAGAKPRQARPDGGHGMAIMRTVTDGNVVIAINDHSTTVKMNFVCPARAHHGSLVRRRRPDTA